MRKKSSKKRLSRREKARLAACFRGQLLKRRRQTLQRLHHELETIEQNQGHGAGDLADQASSSIDRETLYGISTAESEALWRIDHALERIEEGTYGTCEECGEQIPQARLRILPFASLCISCQRRAELEGEVSEAYTATWNDDDDYGVEDVVETFILRGERPGG